MIKYRDGLMSGIETAWEHFNGSMSCVNRLHEAACSPEYATRSCLTSLIFSHTPTAVIR